ncbi:MAG: Calx-beta domain-containing protein [Bdellovibrionales bacterium]
MNDRLLRCFQLIGLIFCFAGCELKNSPLSGLIESGSSSVQPKITVSFLNNLNEGDTDLTVNQAFSVVLDQALDEPLSVQFSITDITSTNSVDYEIAATTLTFQPGETTKYIPVVLKGDVVGEGTETFKLTFTPSSQVDFANSEVTAAIIDNDPIVLSVDPLYPTNGADWLDYVSQDLSKAVNEQNDTACSTSLTFRKHSDCLNGGVLKKVVAIGEYSCASLTMTDQLDAFNWECSDSEQPVYFYSTGFKTGKGLKDLVDATAFKQNKVTLNKSAVFVADSPLSTSWWSNTISNVTLNSGGADAVLNLSVDGTIYTVSSSGNSRGILLSADRASLVTLPGVSITATSTLATDCNPNSGGSQQCLIYGGPSTLNNWVEGHFIGSTGISNGVTDGGAVLSFSGFSNWRIHWLYFA